MSWDDHFQELQELFDLRNERGPEDGYYGPFEEDEPPLDDSEGVFTEDPGE